MLSHFSKSIKSYKSFFYQLNEGKAFKMRCDQFLIRTQAENLIYIFIYPKCLDFSI